jgi:hypothetical protein
MFAGELRASLQKRGRRRDRRLGITLATKSVT